ncbi:MAG TPA: hypothetical protein VK808_09665 [Bacteroidia bacterium]|jgi:hypothetical protein|nr:hypothetical protein [Bacteroidia bacterium]
MVTTSSGINTDTVELEVKQGILFKNKLIIDRLGITFGKKYVPYSDIESLRYGATNVSVNGIPTSVNYTFDFLETNQKKFRVAFAAVALSKKSKSEATEDNSVIINVLWKHLTSKMVNKMIAALNAKGSVKVGNFEIERNGIRVSYRKFIFNKQEVLLPWTDCLKGVGPGYLYIQSNSNKRIKAKSSFLRTWNLNAFYSLLNYLWADGNCFKLERGEKI